MLTRLLNSRKQSQKKIVKIYQNIFGNTAKKIGIKSQSLTNCLPFLCLPYVIRQHSNSCYEVYCICYEDIPPKTNVNPQNAKWNVKMGVSKKKKEDMQKVKKRKKDQWKNVSGALG